MDTDKDDIKRGADINGADAYASPANGGEEKEIDLLELAANLWSHRRMLIKWSIIGAVAGLVIAFSIPREYNTTVKLAPESTNSRTGAAGLGALAAMAGFGNMQTGGADAVYPQLYPDVVSSVPFAVSLFDVPVTDIDGKKRMTVREFLKDETKAPWWSMVMGLPGKLIGAIKGGEKTDSASHAIDTFHLTPEENALVMALNSRVSANIDAKTNVVTISVEMQDPMVSAMLADTVVARLQEYVTAYRTNKARKDLEYAEKINREAKQAYYEAQQRYADYQDRNQGLILYSAQTTRDRLENEATLAFNLYNQTSQQLQIAKAKVQENTPVYATVTPATVPIRPASPKKMLILAGCTFLAFVACAAWILFGAPLLMEHKRKAAEAGASADSKEGKEKTRKNDSD